MGTGHHTPTTLTTYVLAQKLVTAALLVTVAALTVTADGALRYDEARTGGASRDETRRY